MNQTPPKPVRLHKLAQGAAGLAKAAAGIGRTDKETTVRRLAECAACPAAAAPPGSERRRCYPRCRHLRPLRRLRLFRPRQNPAGQPGLPAGQMVSRDSRQFTNLILKGDQP